MHRGRVRHLPGLPHRDLHLVARLSSGQEVGVDGAVSLELVRDARLGTEGLSMQLWLEAGAGHSRVGLQDGPVTNGGGSEPGLLI